MMSEPADTLDGLQGPDRKAKEVRFDQQAADFDDRTGVPVEAAQAAARELVRLASVSDGDLVVDVGAGTGNFGRFVIGSGVRYIGLDLSLPMLRVFASKLAGRPLLGTAGLAAGLLAVADADEDWPLVSGSAGVVFFSRAVHLLHQEHVVTESLRVAHPRGAFFVAGRVRRSPESVRAILRGEMRRLLSGHGIAGKGGEEAHRGLVTALEARGCCLRKPGRVIVASWTVQESPGASLDSWRSKEGLAGVPVPAKVKRAVLEELEGWAKDRFGGLQEVRASEEQYKLTIIETGTRAR